MNDSDREDLIDVVKLQFINARSTGERRDLFAQMRALIRERSPEQVRKMREQKAA